MSEQIEEDDIIFENDENYFCQFTWKRDYLDELNEDNEDTNNKSNTNTSKRKTKKNDNETAIQQSVLEFTPFQHTHQLLNSNVILPSSLQSNITSFIIFS